eukprot:jgi/Hompol1/5458/HPOL_004459-RA
MPVRGASSERSPSRSRSPSHDASLESGFMVASPGRPVTLPILFEGSESTSADLARSASPKRLTIVNTNVQRGSFDGGPVSPTASTTSSSTRISVHAEPLKIVTPPLVGAGNASEIYSAVQISAALAKPHPAAPVTAASTFQVASARSPLPVAMSPDSFAIRISEDKASFYSADTSFKSHRGNNDGHASPKRATSLAESVDGAVIDRPAVSSPVAAAKPLAAAEFNRSTASLGSIGGLLHQHDNDNGDAELDYPSTQEDTTLTRRSHMRPRSRVFDPSAPLTFTETDYAAGDGEDDLGFDLYYGAGSSADAPQGTASGERSLMHGSSQRAPAMLLSSLRAEPTGLATSGAVPDGATKPSQQQSVQQSQNLQRQKSQSSRKQLLRQSTLIAATASGLAPPTNATFSTQASSESKYFTAPESFATAPESFSGGGLGATGMTAGTQRSQYFTPAQQMGGTGIPGFTLNTQPDSQTQMFFTPQEYETARLTSESRPSSFRMPTTPTSHSPFSSLPTEETHTSAAASSSVHDTTAAATSTVAPIQDESYAAWLARNPQIAQQFAKMSASTGPKTGREDR